MSERRVGVLGATSLVGLCLLALLKQGGWQVMAFSRQSVDISINGVEWLNLSLYPKDFPKGEEGIECWICVAPIWVLPDYFEIIKSSGARRVVALSSTSRFTKNDSSDSNEHALVQRLADSETRLQAWAEKNGVEYVILRPTLIYGRGRDKTISEIVRFIRRFRFFPLLGRADGLRQPVHAVDVAMACCSALSKPIAANQAYNLSGGETLTYREMVSRVFVALGFRPKLFSVPLWLFAVAVKCLRVLPRYRHWSPAMAERMNRDLVFDHAEAARDLNYLPRPFRLDTEDLPS